MTGNKTCDTVRMIIRFQEHVYVHDVSGSKYSGSVKDGWRDQCELFIGRAITMSEYILRNGVDK